MRSLSRLGAFFAGFCLLGGVTGSHAQGNAGEQAAELAFELPATSELRIVRSSRTDTPSSITVEKAQVPKETTRIYDQLGMERLIQNEGVTLQWIDWDKRGPAWVAVTDNGHWVLLAQQKGRDGGRLKLEGFITEIGRDYFDFEGTIKMTGAPDAQRVCNETKSWRFEVTQDRSYYRLREFEWCDYLTDYIDLYFHPDLR